MRSTNLASRIGRQHIQDECGMHEFESSVPGKAVTRLCIDFKITYSENLAIFNMTQLEPT